MRRFTYKPNFKFSWWPVEQDNVVCIEVSMLAENSREKFRPWDLSPEYDERMLSDVCVRFGSAPRFFMPQREVMWVTGVEQLSLSYLHRCGEVRFYGWLRQALWRLESHEEDEWFKVDGKLRWDPHAQPVL